MLPIADLTLVVMTTLVCTAAVTALAILGLRMAGRASIGVRVIVILLATVGSIVASTIAVVIEMFLSDHDLVVLYWVIGIATTASLVAAVPLLHRTVRRSVDGLLTSARQIGDGGVVTHTPSGVRELDAVSAELAETSARLWEAREQIEKLDTARRQFFAWISHDLRTPLSGLRAMTEALEDGFVPDAADYPARIRAKADTLSAMVDDLFELSKLQSGTLTIHPEAVTLLDLVSDAVVDVHAAAAARGIRITRSGIDGHQLWADPRELTRAIGNLLTNAVKYAPDNTEILVSADTRDDGQLVLSVLDHGSGVASEDLGRLFDIGWRADTARTAGAGTAGAGLGLAIVRGIVEAHGGNVEAIRVAGGFRLDLILPVSDLRAASLGAAVPSHL